MICWFKKLVAKNKADSKIGNAKEESPPLLPHPQLLLFDSPKK
jgi:hypothetical protein